MVDFKKIIFAFFVMVPLILLQNCKQDDDVNESTLTVHKIFPEKGASGEIVKISGSSFSKNNLEVMFNGRRAVVKRFSSDTVLEVEVPENVTTGFVTVRNNFGIIQGPLFTSLRNPSPPQIIGTSVSSAEIGEVISIIGSNFKTDTAIYRNIVRIGNIKAPVLEASETELKVVVPAALQGDQNVTVMVLGEPSNSVSVKIKGFEGHLYWSSVSTDVNDVSSPNYVIKANADGSSMVQARESIISPVSLQTSQPSLPYAFNPFSKTFYFAYNDVFLLTSKVYQSSLFFKDFKIIYDGSDPELQSRGVDFNNVNSFTVSQEMNERFCLFGTSPTFGTPIFGVGAKDNTIPFHSFANNTDPSTSFPSLAYSNSDNTTASNTHLYNVVLTYDPVVGKYSYVIHKITLDENSPEEVTNINFEHNVVALKYNHADDLLYTVTQQFNSNGTEQYKLFKVFSDGQKELISDKISQQPKSLNFINSSSGLKCFWMSNGNVWLLNMKSKSVPVKLYENIQEVAGKKQTATNNTNTFLIADDDN